MCTPNGECYAPSGYRGRRPYGLQSLTAKRPQAQRVGGRAQTPTRQVHHYKMLASYFTKETGAVP